MVEMDIIGRKRLMRMEFGMSEVCERFGILLYSYIETCI